MRPPKIEQAAEPLALAALVAGQASAAIMIGVVRLSDTEASITGSGVFDSDVVSFEYAPEVVLDDATTTAISSPTRSPAR